MMLFRNLKEDATPHPRRWWHLPLLLLLIAGTIYTIREYNAGGNGQAQAREGFTSAEGTVFGTFYHINYRHADNLQEGIDSVLGEVDRSLSPFNQESVISAINRNTSAATNPMFREVFTLAMQVSEETDGAFDITVAPLVNAWGFGFEDQSEVSQTAIDSLLQFVGYQKVTLQDDTISKSDPRLMLDCSAIAKGYGVDAVANYLKQCGVSDYMVEIGGEVVVRGHNPQGDDWHVGVNKPTDDSLSVSSELQDILVISDKAMATSGNYRNFYIKGGKKYAHTIDPRTGYPVQHNILSATVVAPDCATADAYATSFMVMGMEGARNVLNHHPELQAYLIYTDTDGNSQVWHSDNLKLANP